MVELSSWTKLNSCNCQELLINHLMALILPQLFVSCAVARPTFGFAAVYMTWVYNRTFKSFAGAPNSTDDLLLSDPAGTRQLRSRGCGPVEGHDGSPGESGGSVAQAERFLNLFHSLVTQAQLCLLAFPVGRPQALTAILSGLDCKLLNVLWMQISTETLQVLSDGL